MEADKRNDMGKREALLILGILFLAALLFAWDRLRHTEPAAVVEISVDGETVATLSLDTDQEFTAQGPAGGINRLLIRDGEVWVLEATCPDKLCIRQGKIHRDGELIVCLPNRMTAKITGGE
ncbi:MAG: NusG domain II-containing protein [Lachnospiraceae bacterium]|nr:NusG domain II-containing protein [Lachnospiraceae bacterium]